MDNAAILRRWFDEVWNQGREQTIDELFATDGIAHGLTDAAETHRGPAAFKPFWAQLRGAFPDIQFTIDDVCIRCRRYIHARRSNGGAIDRAHDLPIW
jgi:hypothetical protein